MGDCHGRMRIHRRHVSVVRDAARNRPAYSGGCLHLRLPAASGSVARWLDEITGKNFARTLIQKPETGIGRETRRSTVMTREEALASLNKSFGEKIQSKTEFRGET